MRAQSVREWADELRPMADRGRMVDRLGVASWADVLKMLEAGELSPEDEEKVRDLRDA